MGAAFTRAMVAQGARVMIADVLDGLAKNPDNNEAAERQALGEVMALCKRFPIYTDLSWWRRGASPKRA